MRSVSTAINSMTLLFSTNMLFITLHPAPPTFPRTTQLNLQYFVSTPFGFVEQAENTL